MIPSCLFSAEYPLDYLKCIYTATDGIYFMIILAVISIIIIAGWSLFLGITRGLVIGSFMTTLISIFLFLIRVEEGVGLVPITMVMFYLGMLAISIFILVIDN